MSTKLWTGNALAVSQIQTYAPGQQLPNTVINATINGKTASYTSPTGSNDDLIAGLITAVLGIVNQAPEFAEVQFSKTAYVPIVPAPNATYLQMSSKVPGVPFTVTISLTTPAKVTVTRVAAGKAGLNEVQQISISPNAESGSSFTLTWGGHTTNGIPTPASAPTSATGSSGVLTGAYLWAVTFITANGETELGVPSTSLTLTAQQGSLTSIPLGPTGTTKRRIYRTKAGGSVYFLSTTINDNTTTTYNDNNTDTTIGANPGPPATNNCLLGELEALTGIGQGNIKVSGTSSAAYAGMTMPTSAITYTIEFRGTLAGASQSLFTGNVSNITILPPVVLATVTTGCPPQNEIQTVGWQQMIGTLPPAGTFTINLPGLGVTTAAILFNASAASVQAALIAAAGPAYAGSFSVAAGLAGFAGYTYTITYQGLLALQPVPLATVNVANIVPAAGDTVTGYQARTQQGTATGRNSAITATLNNSPTGGTFSLTGTLANGSTITATGVSYIAAAASLQSAFPLDTTNVSGSAGGPYTVEAVGEAGSQAVTWTATSSLTGGSSATGSPPSSNTTALSAPVQSTGLPVVPNTGALSAGTYYYEITATNAAGETTPSNEVSYVVANGGLTQMIWGVVTGATGYKVYRGTSSGGENKLLASITSTGAGSYAFFDGGNAPSGATPPGSNTAGISVPALINFGGTTTQGALTSATYYYKITATNASGETTASNEISQAVTGPTGKMQIYWLPVTGATGYNVYRGTSSGSETLIASVPDNTVTPGSGYINFIDSELSISSASPPGSNTTGLAAPVQTNPSTATTGGSLAAATYYYEITALNAQGETTASNEKSQVTTGSTSTVTVNWNTVTGATGYKIYRGTSTGAENLLVTTIIGGSTATYIDTGTVAAAFTIAELTVGAAAVNEVQAIFVTGATGGTFGLAFEGQGTPNLPYNDSAADLQTKLQALSTIGANNMTLSGSAGGPYTATAAGTLAGLPLPLIAANSTGLVGSTTTSQTIVTTQSATGPNFWDNAQNWSPTGVPANGDSVYFQNSNVDCLYNLNQSGTTLANLQIDMSYVGGEIGLPSWNGKYYEYRQQYLQIGVSGTILIGSGKGSGPVLVKLDTGTNPVTMLVNNCGTSLDPTLPAILWKGNRSSGTTTLNVTKGSLGIAAYAGETATVDQINQGYVTNVKSDSSVFVGPGTTINTQWYMTGGIGTLNAACPSLVMDNGALTILDGLSATSVTTLSVIGGTVSDRSTGLITTLTVGTGATYDRSDDARAKTATNCTIYGKSTFLDPNDTITFTNPMTLSDCSLLDVTLDLGTNITLARSTIVSSSSALQNNAIVQGRLTLSSTLPVTTTNVTGAATLYFLPWKGNKVSLYGGSSWATSTIPGAGVSLSLSGLTTSLPFDVFLYSNGGTLTLEAVAWTNGTTRATALVTQDGIYVKSGATGHLYLGTFFTTGVGATEDSLANRYLWNYYNRVEKQGQYTDSTGHTYGTNTFRIWDNNNNAKVNFVVGVVEEIVDCRAVLQFQNSSGSSYAGVGLNSTTVSLSQVGYFSSSADLSFSGGASGWPIIGQNYICSLENDTGGATWQYTETWLKLRC